MIWDVASFCASNLVSVGKGGMNLNAERKRRMAWLNYLVPLVIWHCEFIQQMGFCIISSQTQHISKGHLSAESMVIQKICLQSKHMIERKHALGWYILFNGRMMITVPETSE